MGLDFRRLDERLRRRAAGVVDQTGRSCLSPVLEIADPAVVNGTWRAAEIPAVNGHGTALALARFCRLGAEARRRTRLPGELVAEAVRPQLVALIASSTGRSWGLASRSTSRTAASAWAAWAATSARWGERVRDRLRHPAPRWPRAVDAIGSAVRDVLGSRAPGSPTAARDHEQVLGDIGRRGAPGPRSRRTPRGPGQALRRAGSSDGAGGRGYRPNVVSKSSR
jgi:hypothetical protein